LIEALRFLGGSVLDEASGGIETWTSVKLKHGPTTITNKTTTEPDGVIEYQTTISTNRGDLDSTANTVTQIPAEASIEYSSSATDATRVQPPSS
jgi:hypothetical protein